MTENQPARIPHKQSQQLPTHSNRDSRFSNVIVVGSVVLAIINGALAITVIVAIASGQLLRGGMHGNVGALTFFLGVMTLFLLIARNKHKQSASLTEMKRDRAVLAFAKQEGRPLTVPEVALNCSLRIIDAAAVLNSLTMRGVCQMDIGEDGELFYRFNSFIRQADSGSQESQADTQEIKP